MRKMRRKLKIKKKKKKLNKPNTYEGMEMNSSTSRPRKKIVITRKRLLNLPSTDILSNQLLPLSTAILTNDFDSFKTEDESIDFSKQEDFTNASEDEDIMMTTKHANFKMPSKNEEIAATNKQLLNLPSTDFISNKTVSMSSESSILTELYSSLVVEDVDSDSDPEDYGFPSEDGVISEDVDDIQNERSDEEDETYTETDHIQHVPDYEPFFPELSETFEAPVFLLKTTVLSSVDFLIKTVSESRLRTYTFLITRVSGTEKIVTSTTEVKPHVKTATITETLTRLTTLTLLDLDASSLTNTITSFTGSNQQLNDSEGGGDHHLDEARNYLATRVMSNGVEVIVAGDKSTLPGEPDVKRVLPSSIFKPVTLKPSTLSEHMMMLMPSDASKVNNIPSSNYQNNRFVTKTCLTTFTYLTTYSLKGTKTVFSHEQVVSNIATEERNTGQTLSTPSMGITLSRYATLSVGEFYTTYTYLNSVIDNGRTSVVTSKHTVTNTVTAPDHYLFLIQPSKEGKPQKDTNTYYNTILVTKTIADGDNLKVVSTKEKLTQVVITESVPPKATSVMTSYIALDVRDTDPNMSITTTDVVKTYYVTYTYYNTLVENGKTVVHTNVSTAEDVTTEKLFLHPKKVSGDQHTVSKEKNQELQPEHVVIVATKTYQTTFTYFTTLLQEDNSATPTVVSSHSKIVQNIATETIHPKQLNENYWKMLQIELQTAQDKVKETVILNDGQKLEVTAYKKTINPTKVLPIEITAMPEAPVSNNIDLESSNPNVITGSTIIFFDDETSSSTTPTPSLKKKSTYKSTTSTNSNVIKKTQILTSTSKIKKSKTHQIKPTKSSVGSRPSKYKTDNIKKKQVTKVPKPDVASDAGGAGDILGLGSINIESLKALTPVINAMAGLIETNLKSSRKNITKETNMRVPTIKKVPLYANDSQNRAPIYIPVGDMEVAESQNIASYQLQDTVDWHGNKVNLKRPTHETPLLNGGIPISPGEVITANSDVIVGKPGRILPRVPAIPLNPNYITQVEDLNPPPLKKGWPKAQNNLMPIPLESPGDYSPSIVHAVNKDEYVGPPPPPSSKSYPKSERHKNIPLNHNTGHSKSEKLNKHAYNHIPLSHNYRHQQTDYITTLDNGMIKAPQQNSNLHMALKKNLEQSSKKNIPIHPNMRGSPTTRYAINIQPSIISEPIVLPEIIERSTGQPLLVNIQPSQIAFVNIPHNRTTALIYGGSTEPHRNGQYFDDPSPYGDTENTVNENNNNIIHYSSDYIDNSNQKQVKSVIKVGSHPISTQPDSLSSRIEYIQPSKPQDLLVNANNQNVNVKVPPISFGMFQNGNDFNAHVINHGHTAGSNQFQLPPIAYEVIKSHKQDEDKNHGDIYSLNDIYRHQMAAQLGNDNSYFGSNQRESFKHRDTLYQNSHRVRPKIEKFNQHIPDDTKSSLTAESYGAHPIHHQHLQVSKRPESNKSKYNSLNSVRTPSPDSYPDSVTLADYMTPPTYKPKHNHKQSLSKHPARPVNQAIPFSPGYPFHQVYSTIPNSHKYDLPGKRNGSNIRKQESLSDSDISDSDYDLINAEGELIQESNSRPLRPGEIPKEILKLTTPKLPPNKNYTTTATSNKFKLPFENEVHQFKAPVIADPRPFVRPENYQTNQIVKFDHNSNGIIFKDNLLNQSSIRDLLKEEIVRRKPILTETNEHKHNIFKDSQTSASHVSQRNEQPLKKRPFTNEIEGNRPTVTSLPIDLNIAQTEKTYVSHFKPIFTQTESPFNKTPVDYVFNEKTYSQEVPERHEITSDTPHIISKLNTGEIIDSFNTSASSLEIMQPPKPTPIVYKKPTISLKPIKVEETKRISAFNIKPVDVLKSIVPKPAEDMLPPPIIIPNEEVVGMSPPPITTYRPRFSSKPKVPSKKPSFSLQIDTPIEHAKPVQHNTAATSDSKLQIRTRRPTPSRKIIKTPVSSTRRPYTRRPFRPGYNIYNRTLSTTASTTSISYSHTTTEVSTSTKQHKPELEVIIGDPLGNKKLVSDNSVESSQPYSVIDKSLNKTLLHDKGSSKENPDNFHFNKSLLGLYSTEKNIIPSLVHHTGNEIKIIDETEKERTSTTKTPDLTSVKILPTRFVTHTHTSTVTITKTTVIKTPGGPPSTLTLLVTKTEKSTIVDTVTEFHTLVKPTNIVATVTTTVQKGSLYPSDVYGSTYPSIQIRPTKTVIGQVDPSKSEYAEGNLDDFIITDTDPPITSNESQISMEDNNTILVVMTDKNRGSIIKIPPVEETQNRDEMLNNKVNDILIAGVLSADPPSVDIDPGVVADRCHPECKAARNELCHKTNGMMACVCRPGFARMFSDRPCNPTYTYTLEIELDRLARKKLTYNENLNNPNTSEYARLASTTHEALDRMVMQSDLRDIYHGVHVHTFKPGKSGIVNSFYLQLSDNTDEKRLEDVLKKYLRGNNYSIGGTELHASKENQQRLRVEDFDECRNVVFHDCSENAQCFNLKGTYTCSCKEGYSDMSENILYPGRKCSAELIGCEKCNYHGTCYSRGDDQDICECFQWYSGETCFVNLKVLLIGLVCLGFILFILLLVCCIVTCCKKKPTPKINAGISFFPQRVPHPGGRSTLDRRAMIPDTSSEDSRSETNSLPYVTKQKPKRPKSALKKSSIPRKQDVDSNLNVQTMNEQKDRSLTVMIPRAKYHPAPTAPNMSSYTTFDASKATMSKPQSNEAKLLSYLDAGPSPHKTENKRKYSNQLSESYLNEDEPVSRKTSGALVSAGFEVSATVVNNMGTLGTTCGTEADRSENATLIQKISTDLLSCTGTRSQTNTLRNFEDDDLDPISNWMEIEPRIATISESRSYDETSIPPPMKSLKHDYDTKLSINSHSHSLQHDEVAERDLGSTFLLPHTHLYKADRGSDISGFESL